jgi:hypothetical protein
MTTPDVVKFDGGAQVNESELRPLRNRVQELTEAFENFRIEYVSRDENWEAGVFLEVGFSD